MKINKDRIHTDSEKAILGPLIGMLLFMKTIVVAPRVVMMNAVFINDV